MTKQMIEVDIPEGYEFVRFGKATRGESWLNGDTTVDTWRREEPSVLNVVIVRPVERWRVPTKLDLLNRDSIACRVRDRDEQEWRLMNLIAVSYNNFFTENCCTWKQCEIRDTEPKPKECWIRRHGSSTPGIYSDKQLADHLSNSISEPLVHFVEVPE